MIIGKLGPNVSLTVSMNWVIIRLNLPVNCEMLGVICAQLD